MRLPIPADAYLSSHTLFIPAEAERPLQFEELIVEKAPPGETLK